MSEDGIHWVDVYPAEYDKGTLIGCGYEDCNEVPSGGTFNMWVTISGDFICQDGNKYYKLKLLVSDDGVHWRESSPLQTKVGELIELDSLECGEETWVLDDGYLCVPEPKPIPTYKVTLYNRSYIDNSIAYYPYPENETNPVYFDIKRETSLSYTTQGTVNVDMSEGGHIRFKEGYQDVTRILDLPNFVGMKSCYSMFYRMNRLTTISQDVIKNFDMTEVKTTKEMFNGCVALYGIDFSVWKNYNCSDFSSMFYNCYHSLFNTVNLSGFDLRFVDTVNFDFMFYNCYNLTTIYFPHNINTSNITGINMFRDCTKLNTIYCDKKFKEWCWENQDAISLPNSMREDGTGNWILYDE